LSPLEEEKIEQSKQENISIKDLSEIEIRNPIVFEEVKSNRKQLRRSGGAGMVRRSNQALDEDMDEVIDSDEGIVNRRLPLNSYNH
jgi:hypothetical protein